MILEAHTAYWLVIALAIFPVPLLFLVWRQRLRRTNRPSMVRIILLVGATLSHGWLVAGMWFPSFWGATYSNARFVIIGANFIAMVACSICTFLSKGDREVLLGIAPILTAFLWSIEGAINSVV